MTVGAGWALFVDALTWLAAAALLLGVRIPPRERVAGRDRHAGRAARRLGLFPRTTWLWLVVLAFWLFNAIHTGAMCTLGP